MDSNPLAEAKRYTDEALGLCFEEIEALREEIKGVAHTDRAHDSGRSPGVYNRR